MSRPDLEGIIRSPSAETFLRMVTKGFYDNSYIGLWMYEVIGREWDEMRKWAEGLKDEINPQTCTWSIGIWEWVYGIKTDEALQLEYRRQRILAKILGTKPVNPEVIRRGVARITGCDVDITDFAGPYRFALKIHMQEDGDVLPYGLVREYIRVVKPSHLAAFLTWVFLVVIDSTQLEQFLHTLVQMHWYIPFWGCYIFDGTRLLDDSILLDSRRRYDLRMGLVFLMALGTDYLDGSLKLNGTRHLDDMRRHRHNLYMMFLSRLEPDKSGGAGNFDTSLVFATNFGNRYLYDKNWYNNKTSVTFLTRLGTGCLNGTHNMDDRYNSEISITFLARLETGYQDGKKEHIQNASTVYLASMKTSYLDDKIKHQQNASIKFSAAIGTSGNIGNATVISHRNTYYFDGSELFDGSRQLNAFYKKEGI